MRFPKILAPTILGWYLLVPPWTNGKANILAPFNLWEQFGSFDTAVACQDHKQELFVANTSEVPSDASAAQHNRFSIRAQQLRSARCIQGDDPRLAK